MDNCGAKDFLQARHAERRGRTITPGALFFAPAILFDRTHFTQLGNPKKGKD